MSEIGGSMKFLTLLSLLFFVSYHGYAANPCAPLIKACTEKGYKAGSHDGGKGLWLDCVQPLAEGKTVADIKIPKGTKTQLCAQIIKGEKPSKAKK